jgi:Asp-tRNA(Asn)/Glu-tRNA(Gln) amidotransferase A subunit family amidase
MASVGTDAAGSVRNPASLCGIVGLKPTYGRVSVFGGVPGTGGYSTNHFGPLTRTVADCAAMMQVIAGHDSQDPLSSREPVPDYAASLGSPIEGMRVGIVKGYFERFASDEVSQAVANALDTLRSLGMTVEEVTVPHMDLIPAVQLCASRVESTADAEYYLRNHARDYSPSMLSTQIQALTVSGFHYNQSQRIRRLICEGFDEALDRVDVIVAPTSPIPALSIDESMSSFVTVDGRKTPLQGPDGNFLTLCTIPFNVNGLPSLSINCGFSEGGLPIGMQIAAGAFREDTVLKVAHAYEQAAPWAGRVPPLP